jgi:anti-sigma regulatory factor (Ser/Thr protein kinase)
MEVSEYAQLQIGDASGPGEARRVAGGLARDLALSDTDAGRVALVVTELATNVVKHAGRGDLFLRQLRRSGALGVGVLTVDAGPGISNVALALRDGFSTGGSPGTGLGAIARNATRFDLYSQRDHGAVFAAEVWPAVAPAARGMRIGGVNVPYPGETVSGDGWAVNEMADETQVIVVDGLGHGAGAAEAAHVALDSFRKHAGRAPAELLSRVHDALRPTRGAAVAVASIARGRGLLRFAGIGNVCATIVSGSATRSLVSHHGTAGAVARRIQDFQYPWSPADLLVLHSDGLGTHWTLDGYPGLALRDPTVVAGVLYRDHRRGRDDATVVVLREAA